MHERYARTPEPKQMVMPPRADHLHFADNAEAAHEQLRSATLPAGASWIAREMRPIAERCSGEEAHRRIQVHPVARLESTLEG